MRAVPALLLATLLLAACGESDSTDRNDLAPGGNGGSGGAGGSGGGGPVAEPIVWGACPSGEGECTLVDVPLDWEAPEGERIEFFVRRIRTAAAESKGQLWLLQGGPGAAGWAFNNYAPYFQELVPGYDIYIPDYRGNGYSAWLGCEGQDGDTYRPSCGNALLEQWGEGLAHFNTSAAARDIGTTIERIRQPGERVYLFGTSYGTFMLNRYLTLFPDQADAAILDSVCPASGCDVRMDRNFVGVAEHVYELCAADAFCASKLGADPWAKLMDVLARFEQGHCADFYGGYPNNRRILEALALYTVGSREIAPIGLAAAYRADRCNAEDVAALQTLTRQLFGIGRFDLSGDHSSIYLGNNVIFSEFWPEGLDRAAAETEIAALPLQSGALLGRLEQREIWPWPFYETAPELMDWSRTETPILLLNGDLDGQTTLAGLAGVEETFQNESQHFVSVPLAGHGVIFNSPMSPNHARMTCGMELVANFFGAPEGELDTGCAQATPTIEFESHPAYAQQLFGTADVWENEETTGTAMQLPLTPFQEKALEDLRRLLAETVR